MSLGRRTHYSSQSRRTNFLRERLPEPLQYYEEELPDLTVRGKWAQARCCFHRDTNPSLSVNVESGGFVCFACDAKGGDVLAFHRLRYQLSFRDAAIQLGAWRK